MQLIMVATDDSDGSDRAVRAAAEVAACCSAKLAIITVQEPGAEFIEGMEEFARIEGGMGEAVQCISNSILERARGIAVRSGVKNIDQSDFWGDPAGSIIAAVERLQPDLVVVGRRGRGRLAGLLLGSVSQKLVTLCTRPVMVVP